MKDQAHGGTELQHNLWKKYIPAEMQHRVHLSVSAIDRPKRPLKPHIFWAHQAPDQPSVQNLADPLVRQGIDAYVFVSEWQRQEYLQRFPLPPQQTYVVRNAIEPIEKHTKPAGPLQLIYTSTPFRGLDILLDAFADIRLKEPVELHIYSGMSLYGRPAEDEKFRELYEKAKRLDNVYYHGVVANTQVRDALKNTHILVYPCTWEETSCIALIEALSAGCYAVVPDLGALPETAGVFAQVYPYESEKRAHTTRFKQELEKAIQAYHSPGTELQLARQVVDSNRDYAWAKRKGEWEQVLCDIIAKYGRTV